MEQKNLTGLPSSLPPSGSDGTTGRDDVERLNQLINSLKECSWGELPPAVQQSLHGREGLRRLAGVITILLIDYGGARRRSRHSRTGIAPPTRIHGDAYRWSQEAGHRCMADLGKGVAGRSRRSGGRVSLR